jgi:hypothetical protein
MRPGDLVISRRNLPIVRAAFDLIRLYKKAAIVRDDDLKVVFVERDNNPEQKPAWDLYEAKLSFFNFFATMGTQRDENLECISKVQN